MKEEKKYTKKLRSLLKHVQQLSSVLPFTETPAEQQWVGDKEKEDNKLHATELFSMFTADIIKEEVIFTR